ncbi:MAG TPA: radical SAM protein, partial [Nitrospirota bacterium]|nr:radical SAM protein [Nitrospirota bacterium]
MCVKQRQEGNREDGLLAPELFERIAPALSCAEAVILNGIGEPLLNPHLESFIRTAKNSMPSNGWVGFQSNGLLITPDRAA